MSSLEWIDMVVSLIMLLAFVGTILVYGKQIRKRITHLPKMQKGERDFRPYY